METNRLELEIQSLESGVESWLHQELCDLESHLSHRISSTPSPPPTHTHSAPEGVGPEVL